MASKKVRERLIKEGRTLKTISQWNEIGYRVCKGERSLCRTEYGDALFTEQQVYSNNVLYNPYEEDEGFTIYSYSGGDSSDMLDDILN